MKILIDASTAREGGGLTYLRYFLPALRDHSPADDIYLLLSARYQSSLIDSVPEGVYPLPYPLNSQPLFRYLQLRHRIPRLIDALGVDLFFSVSELTVPTLKCPMVVLVRNPKLFLTADHLFSPWDKVKLRWRQLPVRRLVHRALHGAARVAFVTRWFQQYVVERTGINPEKATVVYHGCADLFRSAAPATPRTAGKEDPYILVVSNITFHKNLITAIRGLAAFLETAESSRLRMRIAGPVTERRLYEKLVAECAGAGIKDHVEFLGQVSHGELVHLYSRARIFLFPSLMESFGHPLLEALSCGVPTIVSDLPVFREIAGEAVEYFPARRPDCLAEKIALLMNRPELCRRRSKAGIARAAEFTWEETAIRLRRLFQEVVSRAPESTLSNYPASNRQIVG